MSLEVKFKRSCSILGNGRVGIPEVMWWQEGRLRGSLGSGSLPLGSALTDKGEFYELNSKGVVVFWEMAGLV